MCLYITRRYVHTGGRVEITTEWVHCRQSTAHEPCINVTRRDETIPVGSSSSFPELVHDISTASSTMPGTPISATSGPPGFHYRNPNYNYEIRSPSRSPHSRTRRYRLSFHADPGAPKQHKTHGPRPLVVQPVPPVIADREDVFPLPEGFQSNHSRTQSEEDDKFWRTVEDLTERSKAREELERQERHRRRHGHLASKEPSEITRNKNKPGINGIKDNEWEERMLDEHETRTSTRLQERERLREAASKRRQSLGIQQSSESESICSGSIPGNASEVSEEQQRQKHELSEADLAARLRIQILEGRQREMEQEQQRVAQDNDLDLGEPARAEHSQYAQSRQGLDQQIREREQYLERLDERRRELDAEHEARVEYAQQEFQELDRRLRARGRQTRLNGLRLGERRNITATSSSHLSSLGSLTSLDNADARRARGQQVLEEARRMTTSLHDEEDDDNIQAARVSLTRRNTTGAGGRTRESQYRRGRRQ